MDAGVKIKAPVAGIAMGLIKEGQRYCVLTDILGSEDRHGDMDFKVAGTQAGITALQMDLKTSGIDFDIIRDALGKARDARLYVLERMRESISEPRAELSVHAPKLIRLIIDPEKIGLLIGPGGKTVKEIQQKTGATLEIAEDGVVIISAKDMVRVRMASEMVEAIVEDLKVGRIYRARVTSLKDFGAFIEVIPTGQEGLLHISEISEGFVRRVEDYLRLGQEIDVKIVSFDDQGRPRFSLKAARRDPSPEGLQV
jgi:polyribonucleotide nucleotidyltransferase